VESRPIKRRIAAAALTIAMLPSSIHESGVLPFAPASMNAILAATGKRIPASPIGKQLQA
jgi:CO/xanthine dehydrogenase Mo-binding subunit